MVHFAFPTSLQMTHKLKQTRQGYPCHNYRVWRKCRCLGASGDLQKSWPRTAANPNGAACRERQGRILPEQLWTLLFAPGNPVSGSQVNFAWLPLFFPCCSVFKPDLVDGISCSMKMLLYAFSRQANWWKSELSSSPGTFFWLRAKIKVHDAWKSLRTHRSDLHEAEKPPWCWRSLSNHRQGKKRDRKRDRTKLNSRTHQLWAKGATSVSSFHFFFFILF